jgi:hypothetical protein
LASDPRHLISVGYIIENDGEFIAAKTDDHVTPAHYNSKSTGHLDQQGVSGWVPQ